MNDENAEFRSQNPESRINKAETVFVLFWILDSGF
jgi:hypothetical protein